MGVDWSMVKEQQRVRAAMRAAAIAAVDAHLAQAKAPPEWADELRMEIANHVALGATEGAEQTPKDALLCMAAARRSRRNARN